MNKLIERVSAADALLVDAVLAWVITASIEVTCWVSSGVSSHDRAVTAVAAVVSCAPIAVRRRWPVGALVFSMAAVLVSMLLGGLLLSDDNAYILPPLVLGYSAGAGADGRRSAVGLMLALALGYTWAILPGPNGSPSGFGASVWAWFFVSMTLVPAWLIGRYARRHRQRTSAFQALAKQATAETDARRAAAIEAERARIGSELQDIIAHSISAMVIQAGSARLLLRAEPARARDSILTVEDTGRQALSDLRRLLGMLRKDDDPRALSPQPGLGQVAALLEALGREGLACEHRTVGAPMDLTPGIDLVAYRVIEAGLKAAAERAAKHSSITVDYGARELRLEVRGDSTVDDLDATFAPLGQRVELYRGELRTSVTAGGFAMQARLPLDPVRMA